MNICGLCKTDPTEGYLCPGCTGATDGRLWRMPRMYAGLAAFLHPGGRRPEPGHTSLAEAPLPLTEPAFILRGPGGIVGVLEDWRSAMQQARGWGQPVISGSIEHRVLAAARGLYGNMQWIASSWEMAGVLAQEVRQLECDVAAIVNPQDPAERPQQYGPCPVVLDASGTVCGAVLLRRPGQGLVRCRWCGASWPPSRWLALAEAQRFVQDAANAPQDAAELSAPVS